MLEKSFVDGDQEEHGQDGDDAEAQAGIRDRCHVKFNANDLTLKHSKASNFLQYCFYYSVNRF